MSTMLASFVRTSPLDRYPYIVQPRRSNAVHLVVKSDGLWEQEPSGCRIFFLLGWGEEWIYGEELGSWFAEGR